MRIRTDDINIHDQEILLTAKVSDALAHPTRLKIFHFIFQKNRNRERVCNKDVVAAFDFSQATISQHINKLVIGDLIQVKKEDKFSYYYVNLGTLGKYIESIKKFS